MLIPLDYIQKKEDGHEKISCTIISKFVVNIHGGL